MSKEETSRQEQHIEEQKTQPSQESQGGEPVTIGKLLRQVREKKELSIHEVSSETRISSSNLISIEHENYHELPSDTFARGQVAIYANFLGLDGAELAALFFEERDAQAIGRKKKLFRQEDNSMSAKRLAEPANVSSATWAGILFLLIITFIAVFCWYTSWNPFGYFLRQDRHPAPLTNGVGTVEPEPSGMRSGNVSKRADGTDPAGGISGEGSQDTVEQHTVH